MYNGFADDFSRLISRSMSHVNTNTSHFYLLQFYADNMPSVIILLHEMPCQLFTIYMAIISAATID